MGDGFFTSSSGLLLAIALAAAVAALRWSAAMVRSTRARDAIRRWAVPILEFAFVVAIALWVTSLAVADLPPSRLVVLVAVLAVLAWAGRRAIDDFGSGVALRMEGVLESERWVRIGGTEGVIRRVGYRSLEIESDDGQRVTIPYSRVAQEKIVAGGGVGPRAHGFILEIAKNRPLDEVLAEVPAAAMVSPWSSVTRPARVELQSETADSYVLDVTAYSIDPAHNSRIELTVRRLVSADREA